MKLSCLFKNHAYVHAVTPHRSFKVCIHCGRILERFVDMSLSEESFELPHSPLTSEDLSVIQAVVAGNRIDQITTADPRKVYRFTQKNIIEPWSIQPNKNMFKLKLSTLPKNISVKQIKELLLSLHYHVEEGGTHIPGEGYQDFLFIRIEGDVNDQSNS